MSATTPSPPSRAHVHAKRGICRFYPRTHTPLAYRLSEPTKTPHNNDHRERTGPVLHTHRAQNGATLLPALATLLATPLDDPFTPEVVSVPTRGIERWISQQLALHLGATGQADGISARITYPAPDDLIDQTLAAASPDYAASVDTWHPDRSVWPLLTLLDACQPSETWCADLLHHLDGGTSGDNTRRYAVARRLAGLFHRYGLTRPHLITAWRAADDSAAPPDLRWQPELWRRLRDHIGTPAPAELLEQACTALRDHPPLVGLPERLSLYGPSRLDPARIPVLAALAEHRDVHLWLHHPSPALWEALHQQAPTSTRRAEADRTSPAKHPLLASLSRDVQELQARLTTASPQPADTLHYDPNPAAPTTLLQRLHAGLRDDHLPTEPTAIDPHDRSIQIHACHGRARQVEVLREVLLGLLADDPTLEPRDILVMCPDVETYAPLITAVFSTDSHPGGRLRVAVADRAPHQTNPLLAVTAALLHLAASRVTSSEVLDLAAAPAVRLRFRFDEDDLEQLRTWTVTSGTRWGLSAEHRQRWHMQHLNQGTWDAGLNRLLTGVAVETETALIGHALPIGDLDSSHVDLAGRFAELLDRLDNTLQALTGAHPLPYWLDTLEAAALTLTTTPHDGAWQLAQLRSEFSDLREQAHGHQTTLQLSEVTTLLDSRLAGRPTRANFRTGGLSVCTLNPMRSVPHRVVCLLGMDDGAFPRQTLTDGDDLLARDPHLGERDPRREDRQLFLEAIGAATEHLVITYTGADIRTGAQLPPAVPVQELLDALSLTATAPGGRPIGETLLIRHPLQPFDARNFTPDTLGRPGPFSFDRTAHAAAQASRAVRTPPAPFLDGPLPPAGAEPDLDLATLTRFWQHPVKGFLTQRLHLAGASRNEEPSTALPTELDALEQWEVGTRLLTERLQGLPADAVRDLELARGDLPPVPLANAALSTIGQRVDRLVAVGQALRSSVPETMDIDVTLPGNGRLLGVVSGVHDNLALTTTYSKVKARQRLQAWLELLALTATHPGQPWQAVVIGRAPSERVAQATLGPVPADQARSLLAGLADLRRSHGLREPLPLPTETTAAYAQSRHDGRLVAEAEAAARPKWASGFNSPGEDADTDHVLVWGAHAPFSSLWDWRPATALPSTAFDTEPTPFARLARSLWQPLLDAERIDYL